jgi:hypothetical protein
MSTTVPMKAPGSGSDAASSTLAISAVCVVAEDVVAGATVERGAGCGAGRGADGGDALDVASGSGCDAVVFVVFVVFVVVVWVVWVAVADDGSSCTHHGA